MNTLINTGANPVLFLSLHPRMKVEQMLQGPKTWTIPHSNATSQEQGQRQRQGHSVELHNTCPEEVMLRQKVYSWLLRTDDCSRG